MNIDNKKPDECFQIGPIEICRYGNIIQIKNNMQQSDHEILMQESFKAKEDIKNEIDTLINEIRSLILMHDPLQLLQFVYSKAYNHFLETQDLDKHVLEYVSNVIVSRPIIHSQSDEDQSESFCLISDKIKTLYQKVLIYFILNCNDTGTREEELKEIKPAKLDDIFIKSLLTGLMKGNRYPKYEIIHLRELLSCHKEIINKLFKIKIDDLLTGLDNIGKSFTQDHNKTRNNFQECIELFNKQSVIDDHTDKTHVLEKMVNNDKDFENKIQQFVGMIAGYDLSKLTNWPIEFIKKLSWNIDECKTFFDDSRFSGWPIIKKPMSIKPFICIDDNYHCFDYFSLFDNIYRIIEKLIKNEAPEYKAMWANNQKLVTESIVKQLFQKLLPKSKILKNNFYPKGTSKKELAENDLMVIYDDNLLIIEVKAGSYTPNSAIIDLKSHIKSLKELASGPDKQAKRVFDYLNSSASVCFYESNGKQLKETLNIADFNEIYFCCVTLDNLNHLASQLEYFDFLDLEKGTIFLSIDDLRCYVDYFDSPCEFFHFLKERKKSISLRKITSFDELDHLGMYIKYNTYADVFKSEYDAISDGFTKDLDLYFTAGGKKPSQEFPERLSEIIKFLDASDIKNKSFLANYLLDLSQETREQLCNNIEDCINQKKKRVYNAFGKEVRYSLFVNNNDVNYDEQEARNYVLALIMKYEEKSRLELHLYYDKNVLNNIKFTFRDKKDIEQSNSNCLQKLGDSFDLRSKKKIGRNDPCPCGSKLKYKKCHGKN